MQTDAYFQFSRVECPEHVEGQAWVYMLECSDNSLYVGSTTNMAQRLADHQRGKAALWTKRRRPFQLVYTKLLPTYLEASRREKQVKGWSRQKKINLIIGTWK